MKIEQLQLFYQKGDFNSSEFESTENHVLFKKIATSVWNAFDIFSSYNITDFDNTTRSNMLNNLVGGQIQKHCEQDRFIFHPSLTNTRRCLAILDDKYILFFKKSPVSNVKTNQDDLIKNQELDKHVIFVVYTVDEFWSSLSKLEFVYFSSPNIVSYTYDITLYMTEGTSIVLPIEEDRMKKPTVKVKVQESITSKKAQ